PGGGPLGPPDPAPGAAGLRLGHLQPVGAAGPRGPAVPGPGPGGPHLGVGPGAGAAPAGRAGAGGAPGLPPARLLGEPPRPAHLRFRPGTLRPPGRPPRPPLPGPGGVRLGRAPREPGPA